MIVPALLGLWLATAPEAGAAEAEADVAAAAEAVVDVGDVDAIRKRGVLRVLVFGEGETSALPRDGSPALDREAAEMLAESLGVVTDVVSVERFDNLIPLLLAGRGDVTQLGVGEAFDGLAGHAERQGSGRRFHHEGAVVGVGFDEEFDGVLEAQDLDAVVEGAVELRHHAAAHPQCPRQQPAATPEPIAVGLLLELLLRQLDATIFDEGCPQRAIAARLHQR